MQTDLGTRGRRGIIGGDSAIDFRARMEVMNCIVYIVALYHVAVSLYTFRVVVTVPFLGVECNQIQI